MANTDSPFGLKPIRHRNGAPYNGAANPYYIPASYGTALVIGDPVIKSGTSNTAEVEAPGAANSFPALFRPSPRQRAGDGKRNHGCDCWVRSIAERSGQMPTTRHRRNA